MIEFFKNPYNDRCRNKECKCAENVYDLRVGAQVITLCMNCWRKSIGEISNALEIITQDTAKI